MSCWANPSKKEIASLALISPAVPTGIGGSGFAPWLLVAPWKRPAGGYKRVRQLGYSPSHGCVWPVMKDQNVHTEKCKHRRRCIIMGSLLVSLSRIWTTAALSHHTWTWQWAQYCPHNAHAITIGRSSFAVIPTDCHPSHPSNLRRRISHVDIGSTPGHLRLHRRFWEQILNQTAVLYL